MYQPEIERIGEEPYFIAASPAMRRLRTQVELLAQTDVPVLVTGEVGSGKSTVARLIHALSIRSGSQFMRVKCGALTADLLEKELFGYEQAQLNGAREASTGKFEQCSQGTILLEEFDAMPGVVQLRLLKLLETGEFVRCGGNIPLRAEVRVITSTAADLELATVDKRVHEALFYRLSAFELRVPPLRDRREEIPLLLGHMMNRLTRRYGVPAARVSAVLLEACQHYSWPGNLKELESFAKRYLTRADEEAAIRELRALPGYEAMTANAGRNGQEKTAVHASVSPAGQEKASLKVVVRNAKFEAEKGAISEALHQTHWNRKAAARMLHVSYRALLYKIQEYQLIPPQSLSSRMPRTEEVGQAK